MTSPLKTVPRPITTGLQTTRDSVGLPLQEEVAAQPEQSTGSLEDAIEREGANLSLLMLDHDSLEQKRERVERMFDNVAALVSQLTPELCKEEHGKYMALSAKIEQLCLCIQARLVSLKHDVSVQEIPNVAWIVRLFQFTDRARKIIHVRAERIRKRDADTALFTQLWELVRTERERPAKIHEEAVQHVKRLLMYDDQRYRLLPVAIEKASDAMRTEDSKNYHSKRWEALREAVQALEAQVPRLEKEFYDRALKQVQESDNGPRPK